LILISFLITPVFLVYGYYLVLKVTVAGFDELPDFDEWGDMLIDGLKVLIVGIVYMLPVIIIFGGVSLVKANPYYCRSRDYPCHYTWIGGANRNSPIWHSMIG